MPPDPATHPANQGLAPLLLDWPRPAWPEVVPADDPSLPAGWHLSLGTHPDLVEHLWRTLGGGLPQDCRFVFRAAPVLLRPDTGIVFGLAGGTRTLALRLPGPVRAQAIAAGATRTLAYPGRTFDLERVGPEWIFCAFQKEGPDWCSAAYELAAP